MAEPLRIRVPIEGSYDLLDTFWLASMGRGDPCFRVDGPGRVRIGMPGPTGPLAVAMLQAESAVDVAILGNDARWLAPRLPAMLGLQFEPPAIDGPPRLKHLAKRLAGMRLPVMPVVFPQLVRIVLQQLVNWRDACHGWRQLVRRHGATALPEGSPPSEPLMVEPSPSTLAGLPSHEYAACGVLPQHARRIVGLAKHAAKIEAAWQSGDDPGGADRVCELLGKLRGAGPWTQGFLRGTALGDADAVVTGDYGFPRHVAYFFTGEDRNATDEEMLQLLEPYHPHRFYALLLIIKGTKPPPRRGPRRASLRERL